MSYILPKKVLEREVLRAVGHFGNGAGRIVLIEVKASQMPKPTDGRTVCRLAATIREKYNSDVKAIVVHADTERYKEPMPLAPVCRRLVGQV